MKMGYTRLNFSYFFNTEDIEYILDALEFMCRYAWIFLAFYSYDTKRSLWISKDE